MLHERVPYQRNNDKAFKEFKKCLPKLRYFAPQWLGYGKEAAEGAEFARHTANPITRLIGPPRWTEDPLAGAVWPPALLGYVTPEELTAQIQQRNQDQDDPSWGMVEDLKVEAAASDI